MGRNIKILLYSASTRSLLCCSSFILISILNLENVYTQQTAICMAVGERWLLTYTLRTSILELYMYKPLSVTILISDFD